MHGDAELGGYNIRDNLPPTRVDLIQVRRKGNVYDMGEF
jgi:hypothetical protein